MAARRTSDDGSMVPARRGVPDANAMREWAEELVARGRAEGVELTGDDGLLTGLTALRAVFGCASARVIPNIPSSTKSGSPVRGV